MDPLGTVLSALAGYGVIGLIGVALLERVVPVLPSYGILIAIGIAVAEGRWSLEAALGAYIVGSVLGCLPLYMATVTFGEARSSALLERTARWFGIAPVQVQG